MNSPPFPPLLKKEREVDGAVKIKNLLKQAFYAI